MTARFRLSMALAAAALVSALAATPLRAAGSVQQWGPNGNGTLDHKDDLQWVQFHDAKVTEDRAAGIYNITFGPFLRKMDGQSLIITGYMMPLTPFGPSNHFVLTRRSPGCPFCPPNEPTEAIEIFSDRSVPPTPAPITIEGKLHLVSRSSQGLFFRIDGAKIW